MMTVPALTSVSASMDWNVTVPSGRSLSTYLIMPSPSPASLIIAIASSTSLPINDGTFTSSTGTPVLTTSVTLCPSLSGSPRSGMVLMI